MTIQKNQLETVIQNDKEKDPEVNVVILTNQPMNGNGKCSEKENCRRVQKHLRTRCQRCNTILSFVLGAIILILGLMTFKYTFFKLFIYERLKMTPGLPPYELWVTPKPDVYCKIHAFTVLNPDEFLSGADKKIKLKEFGPIIYYERLKHTDVVFHDNSTLSYTISRYLEWAPDLNEPGILNKTLILPNIALLGMGAFANKFPFSAKLIFNMVSKSDQFFVNITVYDYLWNFTTPALDTISKYLPFIVPQKNAGILYNIYKDFHDRVNVRIGPKYPPDEFFLINTYNYQPHAPGLHPERGDCYSPIANSTEGAVYPLFLKNTTTPYYWRKTVCRAIPLYFESEVKKGSLTGYKFVAKTNMYDRFQNLSEDCFKGFGETILPNGLTDVSRCYYNVPVAVSAPHFYGRSGYWNDQLEGFHPNKENHTSFTIIEPTMGVPMEQVARSQSNMIMPKLKHFSAKMQRFSEMIVPMSWIEYHQNKLTPEIEYLIIFTVKILPYFQYVLSMIIVLAGSLYIYYGVRRIQRDHDFERITMHESFEENGKK